MSRRIRREYLEAKVLTAPPQKLHLMLIDAAVNHAQQASELWDQPTRLADRDAALHRTITISGELLAGVRGCKLEFAEQLIAVYNFIFRRVTEAKIHEDVTRLKEALRILRIEQQTWNEVCARDAADTAGPASGRLPQPHVAVDQFEANSNLTSPGGLSLQA